MVFSALLVDEKESGGQVQLDCFIGTNASIDSTWYNANSMLESEWDDEFYCIHNGEWINRFYQNHKASYLSKTMVSKELDTLMV